MDEFFTRDCFAFYEKNDFKVVFSSEQQEKEYRRLSEEAVLSTRLMFYDLMRTAEDYIEAKSKNNN